MEFAPPARSCHVTKWPEFQGYGFTLHHNKKLDVQEIGGWGLKRFVKFPQCLDKSPTRGLGPSPC